MSTFPSFHLSKRFSGVQQQQITTLDFDDSGQFLIATSINKSIQLYDAIRGRFIKSVQSQKYGCHYAKFTHNNQHCIYASTMQPEDHTIRYLSLHDNSFIRYFKGHKALVNSIDMSPTQDLMVSASMDDTVRLWDLRASNPQAQVSMGHPTHTAFDPSGSVIAVASHKCMENGSSKVILRLKDIKMFTELHFLEIELPEGFRFNKIEFSNDNKYILLSCINGDHLIYDSYNGELVNVLTIGPHIPIIEWPSSGSACFTPDGKYVLSGNGRGVVQLFEVDEHRKGSGIQPKRIFESKMDLQPRMVLFNPKFQQFVTADESLNFWLPE